MCEVAESMARDPGKHMLEFDFKGSGALSIDGKVVSIQILVPLTLPWDETFDVGSDRGQTNGRSGL